MDLIPAGAPHWHILLNHFPSVGTVIGVGLFLASYYLKSEDLRRAALIIFLLMALLAIPTYVTGAATKWDILGQAEISGDLIAAHQDAALFAFTFLTITGCLSWFALWQYRRFSRPADWTLWAILVLAILSVGFLAQTGSMGGDINHPEIRAAAEALAAPGDEGLTAGIEALVISGAWLWPTMEAAHFIGMAVLFGVAFLVAVRVAGAVLLAGVVGATLAWGWSTLELYGSDAGLGLRWTLFLLATAVAISVGTVAVRYSAVHPLLKNIPFTAMHRLLPLGVLGFAVNVVTGMLFFIADSGRYTAMTNSFFPKMALIVIGGVAVLYFTIFDKPWTLKAGDDAAMPAKVAAATMVLLWTGVLVYGRLLPYLEGG